MKPCMTPDCNAPEEMHSTFQASRKRIFDSERSIPTVSTTVVSDDEEEESSSEFEIHSASKAGRFQSPRSSSDRKVSFGSVEVRRYAVTLGDHPLCASGPPLSLGWAYEYVRGQENIPVDVFEASRKPRPSKEDFRMPAFERKHILKVYCGISLFEMQDVEMQSQQIRLQRDESYEKALKRESNKQYYSKIFGLSFLRRKASKGVLAHATCT